MNKKLSITFFKQSTSLNCAIWPLPRIHLNRWLTWLPHIANKLRILSNRLCLLCHLFTSKHLNITTKLKLLNIKRIQRFQSIVLRTINKSTLLYLKSYPPLWLNLMYLCNYNYLNDYKKKYIIINTRQIIIFILPIIWL